VHIGRSPSDDPDCRAPAIQLYFSATGEVGPCCRSSRPYGNIAQRRLRDLWDDAWRGELTAGLRTGTFPTGCERCATETMLTGWPASYAAEFDHWSDRLDAPRDPRWPVRMEFNLSNRCNLQCIQCNGDLSSTIRAKREKRPPLRSPYGEAFFEDLDLFLPHLRHAAFAGGEPFLAPENFRIWHRLAEVNPAVVCTIVTNGTVWNERVEAVLDSLTVEPVVSIDAFTAATFEAIRVGARHTDVIANLLRFAHYARAAGTPISINTCVMVANLHELPDLVCFAEEHAIAVNPLMVHGPPEASLAQLGATDLRDRLRTLEQRSAELHVDELDLNGQVVARIVEQLRSWLSDDPTATTTVWTDQVPSIMQFRRQGAGPRTAHDDIERLHGWSAGPVHQVQVRVDERAHGWPAQLLEELGLDVDQVEGQPLSAILPAVDRYEVLDERDDRFEAEIERSGTIGRITLVPIRDATGWCDEVVALFTFAH